MPTTTPQGPRHALAVAAALTLLAIPAVSAQSASPFAGALDYTACGAGVLNECGEEGDTQCDYVMHFDISVLERKFEVGLKRECRNTGFSKRYKDRPHVDEQPSGPGPTAGPTGCGTLENTVNRLPGAPCTGPRKP